MPTPEEADPGFIVENHCCPRKDVAPARSLPRQPDPAVDGRGLPRALRLRGPEAQEISSAHPLLLVSTWSKDRLKARPGPSATTDVAYIDAGAFKLPATVDATLPWSTSGRRAAAELTIKDPVKPHWDIIDIGKPLTVPVTGVRPQLDYSVSFRRSAFSDAQLETFSPFIGDFIAGGQSFFMATYKIHYPFLTCEVKCGAAGLEIAYRQNAHSKRHATGRASNGWSPEVSPPPKLDRRNRKKLWPCDNLPGDAQVQVHRTRTRKAGTARQQRVPHTRQREGEGRDRAGQATAPLARQGPDPACEQLLSPMLDEPERPTHPLSQPDQKS